MNCSTNITSQCIPCKQSQHEHNENTNTISVDHCRHRSRQHFVLPSSEYSHARFRRQPSKPNQRTCLCNGKADADYTNNRTSNATACLTPRRYTTRHTKAKEANADIRRSMCHETAIRYNRQSHCQIIRRWMRDKRCKRSNKNRTTPTHIPIQ